MEKPYESSEISGLKSPMIKLIAPCTNVFSPTHGLIWGAERRFQTISGYLDRKGISFIPIFVQGVPVAFSETLDGEGLARRLSYSLILGRRFRTIMWCIQGARIAHQQKCDGVYAYEPDSRFVFVPSLFISILTRRPLFVGIHDDARREDDISGVVGNLRNGVRRHLRPIVGPVSSALFIWLRKWTCKNYAHLICVSSFAEQYAIDVLGAKRSTLTGNGISSSWFTSPSLEKKYDAVYVGRIEKMKGVDTLLLAWRIVCGQSRRNRLVLVGSTGQNKAEPWKKAIDALGITEQVTLAGFVPDRELKEILASSRIFVFPSKREGFGLVVGEAMAVGLPCIISDHPALVRNFGSAAKVVPHDRPDLLAGAILELLGADSKFPDMIKAGRQLVSKMRWEDVSEAESRAILEAVYRNRGKPPQEFSQNVPI